MQAGVSDHVWDVADIVKLVEDAEPKAGKRGPYKKAKTAGSIASVPSPNYRPICRTLAR